MIWLSEILSRKNLVAIRAWDHHIWAVFLDVALVLLYCLINLLAVEASSRLWTELQMLMEIKQ